MHTSKKNNLNPIGTVQQQASQFPNTRQLYNDYPNIIKHDFPLKGGLEKIFTYFCSFHVTLLLSYLNRDQVSTMG